jgi:CBS domain containing-hemolysin-like protein
VIGTDIDDVLGVAHVKDVYALPHEARGTALVGSIMQEALVVPETRSLDTLLLEMRRGRKQMTVVVDEYGGTAGIITLEDLLEEIVGEIEDEYDPSATALTSPLDGTHLVSGLLHPDEVYERTGFQMPEGDYETLAGYLLTLFDRIPEPGEHVACDGWEAKVVTMERNRIAEVLLVRDEVPDDPPDGEESG